MVGTLPPESSAAAAYAAAAEAATRAADASTTAAAQRLAARKEARAAALARVVTAEAEAAAAAQERDVADARLRKALARAAHECKGAPPDSDEEDDMMLHEAAAVLNLQAQAVAMQNIRSLIPIILNTAANNYSRWCEQFLLTVGKYSLQDHILHDVPALAFPDWGRMVCVIRSCLYDTIAIDLVDIIMDRGERDTTGCATWLAIEMQFLGNWETRALYLDAKFRTFVQSDLSITDYCRRFKSMADALGDLGEQVSDRTLILNIIRGLNEKFAAVGRNTWCSRPLHSFLEARDDLLLEELTMAPPSSTPSTALLTGVNIGSSSRPSAPLHQSAGRSGSGGSKRGPSSKQKRDRGRRDSQQRQGSGNDSKALTAGA
ncbi:uncharacterized protein LOC101779675 [Setaria italica]|uniref:uncharacterized protein LOC101779675 n=1 Tax=Setaria italica TaxID=4555 RepID=UPI0006466B59|nr:uncharacterized protein LOC101779675 [Setaria italica]